MLNLFKQAETDVKVQGKIETHLESNQATAKELKTLVNTAKEIERCNVAKNTLKDITENSKIDIDTDQFTGSATENTSENLIERVSNSTINIKTRQNKP